MRKIFLRVKNIFHHQPGSGSASVESTHAPMVVMATGRLAYNLRTRPKHQPEKRMPYLIVCYKNHGSKRFSNLGNLAENSWRRYRKVYSKRFLAGENDDPEQPRGYTITHSPVPIYPSERVWRENLELNTPRNRTEPTHCFSERSDLLCQLSAV